jgi:alcohol dehydrogenase class IV
VPHGLAGGIFLSTVSRFNVDRGADGYGDFCDLVEGQSALTGRKERALAVCDALEDLTVRLDLPSSLQTFGVSEPDLDRLAEQTFLLAGAIEQNPVEVTGADVRNILGKLA